MNFKRSLFQFRPSRFLPRASALLIIGAVFFWTLGCDSSGSKELAPGVVVSSYVVQHLDGTEVELNSLFGKVTVVSFMASWCESCKEEFASLNSLHRSLKSEGGLVLGIALDDTLKDLKETQKSYNLEFPIVFDSKAKARKLFKLTGFPETLILDSKGAPKLLQDIDGRLTVKFVGPRPWDTAAMKDQILAMLR